MTTRRLTWARTDATIRRSYRRQATYYYRQADAYTADAMRAEDAGYAIASDAFHARAVQTFDMAVRLDNLANR